MDIILNINNSGNWLDTAEKIATIIGAGGIVFAFLSYINQNRKDERLAVIEQIYFFREKIIAEETILTEKIRIKDKHYIVVKVPLFGLTTEDTIKHSPKNAKRQLDNIKTHDTFIDCLKILNLLEEFSLRVIYSRTEKHSAFNAVRSPFLDLVESHMVILLMQRDIYGEDIYSSTLKLYKIWRNKVPTRTDPAKTSAIIKLIEKHNR